MPRGVYERQVRPVTERFWEKVDRAEFGCWEWTGSLRPNGYGQFHFDGRPHKAHRIAYELAVGPIPEGLQIDHLCRNRRCVKPDHLEPVTHAENVRRGSSGAHWAGKTECPRGHRYDEANTYVYRGRRSCRACKRERYAETIRAVAE